MQYGSEEASLLVQLGSQVQKEMQALQLILLLIQGTGFYRVLCGEVMYSEAVVSLNCNQFNMLL